MDSPVFVCGWLIPNTIFYAVACSILKYRCYYLQGFSTHHLFFTILLVPNIDKLKQYLNSILSKTLSYYDLDISDYNNFMMRYFS